jgi:hypothetical protein
MDREDLLIRNLDRIATALEKLNILFEKVSEE